MSSAIESTAAPRRGNTRHEVRRSAQLGNGRRDGRGSHGGADRDRRRRRRRIFAVTKGLFDRFGPSRVFDAPISEMGYVGAAVGAAMTGLRPIVEIMFMTSSECVSTRFSTKPRSSAT